MKDKAANLQIKNSDSSENWLRLLNTKKWGLAQNLL